MTVNSTVALDAAVLGVPALVIGLPNNLSPFVEAGRHGGRAPATSRARSRRRSGKSCMMRSFARGLARAQRAFLSRFRMAADGQAAERAAEAIVQLARA